MNWARALAPRLTYWLRTGQRCDHATYDASPYDHAAGISTPDLGWGPWELYDLGRAKHRFCARCGHFESTVGHPVRDGLRAGWRALPLALQELIAVLVVVTVLSTALILVVVWT